MYNDILSIGDKIDMRKIYGPRDTGNKEQYVSQVLDFAKEKKLNIAMPVEKGRIIAVEIGSKYELCFYTKQGLYQARCVIVERFRVNTLFIAVVELLTDVEKLQRRQYFRLNCLIDINYRVISSEELKDKEKLKKGDVFTKAVRDAFIKSQKEYEKDYTSAIIIDISGGGARFNSTKHQEKDQQILLKVPIFTGSETKELNIESLVIASSEIVSRRNTYEHRVEFIDISKEDRELIVKYVFEEERKRRKKEKEYEWR